MRHVAADVERPMPEVALRENVAVAAPSVRKWMRCTPSSGEEQRPELHVTPRSRAELRRDGHVGPRRLARAGADLGTGRVAPRARVAPDILKCVYAELREERAAGQHGRH